ncbi:MAG: prolyl oligopeptidase family serine peptidase [Bacteroidales bacterium]|nr:prolyl oligopeptidase family serine peptidase [Bacteroidales bacterium]
MKKNLLLLPLLFISLITFCQNSKKPLDFSVYDDWKYIESKAISNDGEWILYESNPYKGDGKTVIYNSTNKQIIEIKRASIAKISANSDFIAFKIYPNTDTLRALKLKKTDKDKLPKDSLGILILGNTEILKVENIKSFDIPEKESSWLAYLYTQEIPKDTTKKDDKKKDKKFDKEAPKEYDFVISNPVNNKKYEFRNITEYSFSENGKLVSFIKQQNDTLLKSTIYIFNTVSEKLDSLAPVLGLTKKISSDHKGNQIAYIQSKDTIETKVFSLYYLNTNTGSLIRIVDTLTSSIPEKWTVNENGEIYFSDNDNRIFFGTSYMPEPEKEDTLLDEEKIVLDVWSWTDARLQPQQLSELDDDLKRSYLAVYHIDKNILIQLENEKLSDIELSQEGNGVNAIGYDYKKYEKISSWEIPEYYDIYLVNIETGEETLFKEKIRAESTISPDGKYIYWYEFELKSWFAYSIKNKTSKNLTEKLSVNFYDEENDYPMLAYPYGICAWVKNDEYILIKDRFDIWKIDPTMNKEPICLTNNLGRKNNLSFDYIKLDDEQNYIDAKEELLLSAFNHANKQSGFYKTTLKTNSDPQKITMEDYEFTRPRKAKDSERIIWQKSNYKEYYDLWTSTLDFKNSEKISNENPQQNDYLWGDVELVKWITPDGTEEEGLLYKPENFDPNKKYPMVVYFYRLHSDELHSHSAPKPSRSVINPTMYVSNGYFVFMPNIRYKEGYPGESATNYIVSGTLALLTERSYLDKDHIGLQGQSWGGYQAGFIITRTDLFAAASIGAPVSNMTSAYGGIRWKTGMSRMFQYEKYQSRIGGTLWEKPLHYIENSPVFYAPKINTPVMIRHNDHDGSVPWYQEIEYFVALRRLNKPVWMLNYNGQPHNEKRKSPNSKDLSKRMMQFFDHYLKDEPAPMWMTKGIPATEKGKTMGYELDK